MKVYPPQLDIGEEEGFTPEKDLFGRADLGRQMSSLVATVEDPLVIAFDGVWGSGKTTFLKMWAGELRKAGHPVVFFDAFENDYVEDAFAALARELVELVEKAEPEDEEQKRTFKKKAIELGSFLLRSGAKIGFRGVVRLATSGLVSADEAQAAIRDAADEVEGIADHYMRQMLEQPQQQRDVVEEFRKALEALPALTHPPEEGQDQKPLIFIIDELDRCKPVFALALLERIKHFMSVPNVHFVLGTHLEQLRNSVRYAYGSEIDATLYLQKFISLTIELTDHHQRHAPGAIETYARFLRENLLANAGRDRDIQQACDEISRLARIYNLSLRTLERAYIKLAFIAAYTPNNRLKVGPIVGGLIMMKLIKPNLFLLAKTSSLGIRDAKDFLRFTPDPHEPENESAEECWWTFTLAADLPEHLADFAGEKYMRRSFRHRQNILSEIANTIVDRISPDL